MIADRPKKRKLGPPLPPGPPRRSWLNPESRLRFQFTHRVTSTSREEPVAEELLSKGWLLVPVDSGSGALAEGAGGPTGDLAEVRRWLDVPELAFGVVTGRGSGMIAVAIEKGVGERAWKTMLGGRQFDRTLRAFGKGRDFLFFRAPEWEVTSRAGVAPGVDILGEGGHFVTDGFLWREACNDLAPFPKWMSAYASGESALGLSDLVKAGYFTVLNGATAQQAAEAYHALGWRLLHVEADGDRVSEAPQPPGFWRANPDAGLAVASGCDSGVVALRVLDATTAGYVERRYGQLPTPQASGSGFLFFFRAPQEGFSSRPLFRGVGYVGEGGRIVLPPPGIWDVAREPSPELPALPGWLFALLSGGARSPVRRSTQQKGPLGLGAKLPSAARPVLPKPAPERNPLSARSLSPAQPSAPAPPKASEPERANARPKSKATGSSEAWRDRFTMWLRERCEAGDGFETLGSILRHDLSSWCGEQITPRRFGDLMNERGIGKKKSSVPVYLGLRLR